MLPYPHAQRLLAFLLLGMSLMPFEPTLQTAPCIAIFAQAVRQGTPLVLLVDRVGRWSADAVHLACFGHSFKWLTQGVLCWYLHGTVVR